MAGRNITLDSNFCISYGVLVLLLLPPLTFCILYLASCVEIRSNSMGASKVSESSVLERDDHNHNDDTVNVHSSAGQVFAVKTAPPSPTLRHQNILDSSLDDIQVPILQPVPILHTKKVIAARVDFSTLLDDELDLLSTPALKPKQVSPATACAPLPQLSSRGLVDSFSLCLRRP